MYGNLSILRMWPIPLEEKEILNIYIILEMHYDNPAEISGLSIV